MYDWPGASAGSGRNANGRHGTNAPNGAAITNACVGREKPAPAFHRVISRFTRSGAELKKLMSDASTCNIAPESTEAVERREDVMTYLARKD
jgi:hypothetical protein